MSGRNRTDDTPIRVGSIEVASVDGGRVHVSVGDEGVTLDRRGCTDLVHALLEALDTARAQQYSDSGGSAVRRRCPRQSSPA